MIDEKTVRNMVCPYCGFQCQSGGIGAVYCGPHLSSIDQHLHANCSPAVRMIEKEKSVIAPAPGGDEDVG